MFSIFRKNKKGKNSIEQEGLEQFLKRMMQEGVVVELRTYYQTSNSGTIAYSACAVYPNPITGKSSLLDLDVSPTFRYLKFDSIEYLFIEIEFSDRKERFVLVSKYDNKAIEFLKATIALGHFVFTENPLTQEGIKIPIVQPKILTDILDKALHTFNAKEEDVKPTRTRDFSGKVRKCINCGFEFQEGGMKCTNCGSERFTWE